MLTLRRCANKFATFARLPDERTEMSKFSQRFYNFMYRFTKPDWDTGITPPEVTCGRRSIQAARPRT